MIAETASSQPTTMGSLEDRAGELTDNLKDVRNRLRAIYDAMNGERPACVKISEDRDRAAGSIPEIGRRMVDSMSVVGEIKDTLAEIESVVLPEKVETE